MSAYTLIELELLKDDVRVITEEPRKVKAWLQAGMILSIMPEKLHPDQYSDILVNSAGNMVVNESTSSLAARVNAALEKLTSNSEWHTIVEN